jgi:hypothetical protein
MVPPTIANTLTAIMATVPDSDTEALIKAASGANSRAFGWYVGWLVVSGVATIAFTWWMWSSSNRQTDAVIEHFKGKTAKLEGDASKAKESQQRVETDLEKQKEKTAQTELELEKVRKKQGPRMLGPAFGEALKGKPTAWAEVMFAEADDSWALAMGIMGGLMIAGWDGPVGIRRIPPGFVSGNFTTPGMVEYAKQLPETLRAGAYTVYGVSIVRNTPLGFVPGKDMPPYPDDTPFNCLYNAFVVAGVEVGHGFDPTLPNDRFRIVVGGKSHTNEP